MPNYSSVNNHNRTPGIRRTVKVYGPVDPKMEERRRRHAREYGQQVLKPHSGIETSVKEKIA